MHRVLITILLALNLFACSHDSLKRTGYETFQNIEQEQCIKNLGSECPPREKYEDYQKRRDAELEKSISN